MSIGPVIKFALGGSLTGVIKTTTLRQVVKTIPVNRPHGEKRSWSSRKTESIRTKSVQLLNKDHSAVHPPIEDGKKGKTALITGGTRGIGRALTEQLLVNGWKVATVGTSKTELAQLKNAYKDSPLHAKIISIENMKMMEEFIEETENKFGPIHACINNAAILGPMGPIGGVDRAFIRKVISVNLTATICLSSIIIEKMRSRNMQGVIVNISSQASKGVAGIATYSATKAAINAFSTSIANEYLESGIHIFALNPGRVKTRLFDTIIHAGPEKLSYASELSLIEQSGLVLTPAESASHIYYLLKHPERFESMRILSFSEIQKQIDKDGYPK